MLHVVAVGLGLFFHFLHVSFDIDDELVDLVNVVGVVFSCGFLGRCQFRVCVLYFNVALVMLNHDLRLLNLNCGGRLESLLVLGADLGQAVTGVTRADLCLAGQRLGTALLCLLKFN